MVCSRWAVWAVRMRFRTLSLPAEFQVRRTRLRIVIPITGSRGDVQPYIALGKGLQEAGHTVRVATHTDFEPAVRAHGLDYSPLGGSSYAMHTSEGGRRMVAAGRNPFTYLKELA